MGVMQVGFVVVYLSDTLVSGFTTAAAIHILVSQLKFVLGLPVPGLSGPLSLIYVSVAPLLAAPRRSSPLLAAPRRSSPLLASVA